MRIISTFFLLCSLIAALLFFNRLSICEKIITSQMRKVGASDIQVTVQKISASRIAISSLSAVMGGEYPLKKLSLQDLQLTFTIAELAAGKIEALRIDTLHIELAASTDKGGKAVDPAAIFHLQLPSFLPQKLSIGHLLLSGECPPAVKGRLMQVEAQFLPLQQKVDISFVKEKIHLSGKRSLNDNSRPLFELQGNLENEQFFTLTLQQDNDGLSGTLNTSLSQAVTATSRILPSSLPKIAGKAAIFFNIPAASQQSKAAQLSFRLKNPSFSSWQAESLFGKLFIEGKEISNLTLTEGSQITAENIKKDALFVEKMQLRPRMKLQSEDDTLDILIAKDFQATFTNLRTAKIFIPAIHCFPLESLFLQQRADKQIYINTPSLVLQLSVDAIQSDSFTVIPSPATLMLASSATDPVSRKLHAVLHLPTTDISWDSKQFSLADIRLDLTKTQEAILLTSELSLKDNPGRLHTTLRHNLANSSGDLHITSDPPFTISTAQENIRQLISSRKLPIIINDGTLQTVTNSKWQAGELLFINTAFTIADIEGSFNNLLFRGVKLQQNLQLFPERKSLGTDTFFIGELNAGLVFTDTSISSHLSSSASSALPLLTIDSIQTHLFDGTLSAADIPINFSKPDFSTEIRFKGINTERSAVLKKVAGLHVTGILDGDITIDIHDKQLSISEGKLESRPPGGLISYIPPGGPGSIPQIPEVAMLALEEFHYSSLVAVPRYESDGNLIVSVQTKGKSPKLDSNRPVHLNLNIEQNLLSLLKSLRYTGTLTDGIEKHLLNRSKGDN